MALLLNIENTNVGVSFDSAYAKVVSFKSRFTEEEEEKTVLVIVEFYASTKARQSNSQPVKDLDFKINLSDLQGNVLPAIYAYLKTLPEFSGAEDC